MTGLRTYERDLALPGRLGEPALVPPSADQVEGDLAPRLVPELGADARAEVVYARWKPGVGTTACYRLTGAGSERLLAVKLYAAGKAAELARGDASKGRFGRQHEVDLRLVAEGDRVAWCFPADRELPGAARVLDVGRFARFFDRAGLRPGWRVRRKHFASELVRYRPEARAVFRLDVKLEGPEGEKERVRLGARALRRGAALRVAGQRQLLDRQPEASAVVPRMVAFEERAGLLHEAWLPVETPAPGEPGDAAAAGAALAHLHRLDGWEPAAVTAPHSAADARAWLDRSPALAQRIRPLAAFPGRPRAWVHGDFHADQVGIDATTGRGYLLDLDRLGAGDPDDDLAEWVADALAEGPTVEVEAAGAPLIDVYVAAGGRRPDPGALVPRVGAALVRRAAATLRRLEVNALEHAEILLARAEHVLGRGSL